MRITRYGPAELLSHGRPERGEHRALTAVESTHRTPPRLTRVVLKHAR